MKRKMSALQKKYFGKRQKRKKTTRKVVYVAKRRSFSRARGFARRSYSRARGGIGGKFGQFLPPLAGGIADSLIGNYSIMGFKVPMGAGSALIGHFMKSQTTRDIGLYQVGRSIPSYFGAGGNNSGGFVSQV